MERQFREFIDGRIEIRREYDRSVIAAHDKENDEGGGVWSVCARSAGHDRAFRD